MNLDFYKDKKVFITGHTGFKGSWLTQIMLDSGAHVCGYALNPKTEENHFDLLNLESRIEHVSGDIRDFDSLSKAILNFSPNIVFHMAAQAFVKDSYEDPYDTYETNVMGSLNVLKAINLCESIKSVIYVTSDKCYENLELDYGYKEDDRLGGHDPYSSSKACAEILFSSFYRSYLKEKNIGIASVRAGNVIGGGDFSSNRIIPDCIRAIRKDKSIVLRHPLATRPWQHVLEPISGYILLANKLYENPDEFSLSWNFGPNSNEIKTVRDVSRMIIDIYGKGEISEELERTNFHEAGLLALNCELANNKLGWTPNWSMEKTIANTARWYKMLDDGRPAAEITSDQIKEYFQ